VGSKFIPRVSDILNKGKENEGEGGAIGRLRRDTIMSLGSEKW